MDVQFHVVHAIKNELCCMILYMFSDAAVMAQHKIILSLTQLRLETRSVIWKTEIRDKKF